MCVPSCLAVLTLCDSMDCILPGSSVYGIPQEGYWSGLPLPSPEDLPDSDMEAGSPALQQDSIPFEPQESPYKID